MRRLLLLTILTVTLLGAVAAPAWAFLIPHPEGDAVILRISVSPSFWAESDESATLTLRGDGRVVIREIGPGQQVHRFRITEEGVQIVLRGARDARLFDDATEYGESLVTDQGSTSVRLRAAGERTTADVYALDLVAGDDSVDPALLPTRRALRSFVDDVLNPAFYDDVLRG